MWGKVPGEVELSVPVEIVAEGEVSRWALHFSRRIGVQVAQLSLPVVALQSVTDAYLIGQVAELQRAEKFVGAILFQLVKWFPGLDNR